MSITKLVSFLFVLLAACAPAPQAQGAIAMESSPMVVTAAPDTGATISALEALQAQVTGTAQAKVDAVTRTAQAERSNATATSAALFVAQAGATLTAGVAQATRTAEAMGTATKAAQPAAYGTEMSIRNRTAAEIKRAEIAIQTEVYRQWGAIIARVVLFALLGFAVVLFAWHTAPATARRIEGEKVIRALYEPQLVEPPRGYLPAPSDGLMPISASESKLIEFRSASGKLLLGYRDLLLLASSLHRGVPFSENSLGRAIPNFREVQDEFLRQRKAEWRHPGEPRQGVALTRDGERYLFVDVMGLRESPPPLEERPESDGSEYARTAHA